MSADIWRLLTNCNLKILNIATGSMWTTKWKHSANETSSGSSTEDEGFVVIGQKWIPFYKPFQAPGYYSDSIG